MASQNVGDTELIEIGIKIKEGNMLLFSQIFDHISKVDFAKLVGIDYERLLKIADDLNKIRIIDINKMADAMNIDEFELEKIIRAQLNVSSKEKDV